jgi:hypothetical protein
MRLVAAANSEAPLSSAFSKTVNAQRSALKSLVSLFSVMVRTP